MSTPASRPGPRLNLRGAVDLSGLAHRAQRPAAPAPAAPPAAPPAGAPARTAPAAPAGASRVVVDVTDADFSSLVQLSAQVPVVVDLWATWCGPCKQLSPVLERLAEEYAGAFLLAKVDVDESPQVAAAFQVQSVPTVVAVLAGQPVPLFQGAYPEAQVRQVLDELLKVAAANGVTGRVPTGAEDDDEAPAPAEPPLPPLHAEAREAIARGDLDAAADAYRRALADAPADTEAAVGLASIELRRRTRGSTASAALAAADAAPSDVDAGLLAADHQVLAGDAEGAFSRLVALVRANFGDDRDRVRARLVELFEVVGPDDPRTAAARRALAAALY
ncbi:putative thioredoxin [Quadrisphaera granulorum]|uniref:Putative thioredoxin n=1 Tax=Quadrisphaera granulorum TaxID=317664 RepID=A0A316AFF2_9ACTN|nr:tetratricopeptide repeat protein [Quadrisphaera granulorum]PWJ56302.1 putative thioredoxin [Quadrisphaera granulorum]SZE94936.1 putative thioredoxin [Quadrisphaera granulorum]